MAKRDEREWSAQECVEYAARKSHGLPEDLRLRVYWGTLLALALNPPTVKRTATKPQRKSSGRNRGSAAQK